MSTSHPPRTVDIPVLTWRIARLPDPLNFSSISPSDADLSAAGNRFDVEGGGVLYTSTDPRACFLETLSRFRPSAKVLSVVKDEPGFMLCGGVPADWRLRRVKAEVSCADALPFLDVEAPETHVFLTEAMGAELTSLGIDVLDVAAVRGRNRLVTRAIARWAHAATDNDGEVLFSSNRYVSRLGAFENWAIFDGTGVVCQSEAAIDLTDPALVWASDLFKLRMF